MAPNPWVGQQGVPSVARLFAPCYLSRDAGPSSEVHRRCRRLTRVVTGPGGRTVFLIRHGETAGNAARIDGAFDLIFLDSERPEYPGWWPHLRRVLRPGGLLVVDNATSHPEQMAPFVALVKADGEFVTSLVPVGNGEFLAVRVAR